MNEAALDQINEIVAKDTWTGDDYTQLLAELYEITDGPNTFKAILHKMESETPEPTGSAALKIGIGRYMLCRSEQALEALAGATDNKDRRYFQGLCYKATCKYDLAAEQFALSADRGWDKTEAQMQLAEVKALGGDLDEAGKILAKLAGSSGETAQYKYLEGLLAELAGKGDEAIEAYQQARDLDPACAVATFRLAYYLDLHGAEEEAIDLYKECVSQPPLHTNALLNLAVLYEDNGKYDMSAVCLKRILAINPTHARARLFLGDIESSRTMFYDEDQAKRVARRNALLDTPVTDFELSVRARNCLKKMNLRTLGDLVQATEAGLLSYKNFGETSLKEIKDMLSIKGLHLGQALEDGSELAASTQQLVASTNVQNEGVLGTPIERVGFSIRVRGALEILRLKTVGDLVAKSEPELLACKNFGQTSLTEVRSKLTEYGLTLRETL